MLFLAAESTKERVFIHAASPMFTENLYKSAIILLSLNTNFGNLVVS